MERDFKELNGLRKELRELKNKYENQSIVLHQTEDQLRELNVAVKKAKAFGGDANGQKKEILRLHQVANQLTAQVTQLERDKHELKEENERLSKEQKDAENERLSVNQTLGKIQKDLKSREQALKKSEEELAELKTTMAELRENHSELEASFREKVELLSSLDAEAKGLEERERKMEMSRKQNMRLSEQLRLIANNANRKQNQLQNQLQGSQHLYNELKLEYEQFCEVSKTEWEAEKMQNMEDYKKLEQDFENFKLMQFEDKQQLLREQREVVRALQTQFEEYRSTAEFLFKTEAGKLEDKLNSQMRKYENEIRYIIKAKDKHFDEMMTAKDAKIMNLIEGTDFQNLLVTHEMQMEQLRRSQVEAVEDIRHQMEMQTKRDHAELTQLVATQEQEIERVAQANTDLHGQLHELHEKLDELKGKQKGMEEEHLKALEKKQNELHRADARLERMNQKNQDLRHRLVTIKIEAKGDSDESINSLLRRLNLESLSLKETYDEVKEKNEDMEAELKNLRRKDVLQTKQNTLMSHELRRRTEELRKLGQTFESFLHQKALSHGLFIGGIAGASHGVGDGESGVTGDGGRRWSTRRSVDGGGSIYVSATGGSGGKEDIPSAERSPRRGHEMPLAEAVARLRRILVPGRSTTTDSPTERLGSFAATIGPGESKAGDAIRRATMSQKKAASTGDDIVRAVLPKKLRRMRQGNISDSTVSADSVQELERGLRYLEKFKRLSNAYREGEFSGKLGQKFAGGITLTARAQEGGVGAGDTFLLGQPEGDLTIYADLDKDTSASHDAALVPIYESRSKAGDPRLETAGSKSGRVYSKEAGSSSGQRGSSSAQKAQIYRPRRGANPRETW